MSPLPQVTAKLVPIVTAETVNAAGEAAVLVPNRKTEFASTFALVTVMVPLDVQVNVPPLALTTETCGPPLKLNDPGTTTGDVMMTPFG